MIRAFALSAALVLASCLESSAAFVERSAPALPVSASASAAPAAAIAPLSLGVSAPVGAAPLPLSTPLSPSLAAAPGRQAAEIAPAAAAQAPSAPTLAVPAAAAAQNQPAPAVSAAAPAPAGTAPSAAAAFRSFSSALAAASAPTDAGPAAAKAAQDRLFGEDASAAPAAAAGYDVQVSQPGRIGKFLRLFWPAHTLFRVGRSQVDVDGYLPATLNAFPQPNPSWLTRLKKNVLFSPPVVALIRWQLAHGFKGVVGLSESALFEKLEAHTPETPNKYNIVIERGGFNVMKLDHGAKVPDWILSKHVLMSGYSKDVRFAGEIWKDADGRIHLSNNSGTYRPSVDQLEQAVAYLRAVFPGTEFVADAEPAVAPAPRPNERGAGLVGRLTWLYRGGSDVFKKEVRRKLIHQKNWGYLLAFLMMGYPLSAYVLGGFASVVGALGLLRMHWPPAREWAQRHFGRVLRPKEANQFTGFFYGALGVAVSVALYGWSKPIVAAGILAYVVGDAVSPLVGMRFGWKPYTVAGTKRSADGTLAGFAVVLAMILALGFSPLVALGAALAFSAVDTYPVKPDDNLWIPITVSTALFLLTRL